VRVREGRVLVADAPAAEAGQELRLEPGREPRLRAIEIYGSDWRWITLATAPLEIEGRRLRPYLEWVVRQRGLELRFRDADVERRAGEAVLHGSVAHLPPDDALAVVLSATSLRHRVERGVLHLEPAK
jgi:hypothetical protein